MAFSVVNFDGQFCGFWIDMYQFPFNMVDLTFLISKTELRNPDLRKGSRAINAVLHSVVTHAQKAVFM